jgi:hypothetical protein
MYSLSNPNDVLTLPPSLPALTLMPPWGSLIAACAVAPALGKHIETRSWATRYRGPLAIHQARGLNGMSRAAYAALCEQPFFHEALVALGYTLPDAIPCGAVVAVAELVAIHPTEAISAAISERERSFGDYAHGRFAWELGHIRRVEPPIPARGTLGLWRWDVADLG